MSRRYGGKFSRPETGQAEAGAYPDVHRTRVCGRVDFLFLSPLPLVWQAFFAGADARGMALNLVALGLLLLSAWFTREGIRAQKAYEARKVARRPAFPRKIVGSLLTGLGLALAGVAGDAGLIAPAIYALLGTVLNGLAFGVDPLKDKGMEAADRFQSGRVARVVDRAESYLEAMTKAVRRAGDRSVEARVKRFQSSVREMLRTVEEDPRDLTGARKFLGVYLMGARDATAKFADIYARTRDAQVRSDFLMLLTDLEENFVAKTRTLLADDQRDLDIEISVLRDRLQREGVQLDDNS